MLVLHTVDGKGPLSLLLLLFLSVIFVDGEERREEEG